MLLDLMVVTMVAEARVDFKEARAVVVANVSPTEEGVEEVALVSTSMVEVEVVLMVDGALCEDDGNSDDTPPFLKMPLVVAGIGHLSRLESKRPMK